MPTEPTPQASPLPPPPEPDGWDLLDDYQTGKDLRSDEEKVLRRAAADQTDRIPASDVGTGILRRDQAHKSTLTFWRDDGSAAQDAEIMSRIMGRQQERAGEARSALERARTAKEEADAQERADRERIRERQRREIETYLAMQRQEQIRASETPLQAALREIADVFLALGICADHLEYLPDIGRFCSWGGKLYDHSQLFAIKDAHGRPAYALGPSQHGPSTACYSPRERRWRLHHPVDPALHITPVDRLLPVPRRHADGSLRFSAQRPGTLLMEEGVVTIYVVGNGVYTLSQLQAAHVLHSGASPLTRAMADAAAAPEEAPPQTVTARVVDALGSATDKVGSVIASTTRLFRRK